MTIGGVGATVLLLAARAGVAFVVAFVVALVDCGATGLALATGLLGATTGVVALEATAGATVLRV